jgi:plasmid stabilization system protein ParE
MIFHLIVRPEAEADIREAYLWYEEQRFGLGEDFLLCVEEGLAKIQRNPEMYPIVHKDIRRILIRRFPFGIFYIATSERLVILAVLHGRRDPKRWKDRA